MAMIENINNCQKNVLNWMKVKTLFQGNFVIFATRKYFIKIKQPRTPQQHEIFERKNKMLPEQENDLVLKNNVLKHLWSEAINIILIYF